MSHDCKRYGCDEPHYDEPITKSEYEWQKKQFISWAELQGKKLCSHGFRRCENQDLDCQTCLGLELDRAIEADAFPKK